MDDEWKIELVLPMMEPHKEILFGHVYSHRFMVYTKFEVLVSGCFTVKSLEAVQAEVLSSFAISITACEKLTKMAI